MSRYFNLKHSPGFEMIVLISDVILHYIVFPDENRNNDTDLAVYMNVRQRRKFITMTA